MTEQLEQSFCRFHMLCLSNEITLTKPSERQFRLRKEGKEVNVYPVTRTYVYHEGPVRKEINEYKTEAELVNKIFNS